MKKPTLITIISLPLLFLFLVFAPVSAQEPVDLVDLTIKLWPEYDDPRLLVIIDGQLATPGDEIRLPIPDGADLNAVATAGDNGRLLKNEWREEKSEDGSRILVMTPTNPVFRVEYYTPFPVDGDKREIKFELPAGYFNADQATIEVLLPPGSEDISLTPPADESGPSQDESHIFRRVLENVKNQTITQQVVYTNPSGALTVPETQATSASSPQPQPSSQNETESAVAKKFSSNIWIIALGVVAALLIVGGAIGLWLTRDRDDEEPDIPSSPSGKRGKRRTGSARRKPATGNMDRFCRQCGEEFGEDDRFCRYCGTPRQTL